MRTTIEISNEIRAKLMALAARRDYGVIRK